MLTPWLARVHLEDATCHTEVLRRAAEYAVGAQKPRTATRPLVHKESDINLSGNSRRLCRLETARIPMGNGNGSWSSLLMLLKDASIKLFVVVYTCAPLRVLTPAIFILYIRCREAYDNATKHVHCETPFRNNFSWKLSVQ